MAHDAQTLLSQVGLKSAQDVKTFLNSDAGKITQSIVQDRFIEQKILHQDIQRQIQEKHVSAQRHLAAFILAVKEHRKALHFQSNDEFIIEAQLQKAKKSTEKLMADMSSAPAVGLIHIEITMLEKNINALSEEMKQSFKHMAHIHQTQQTEDKNLNEILEFLAHPLHRYQFASSHLRAALSQLKGPDNLHANTGQKLQAHIHALIEGEAKLIDKNGQEVKHYHEASFILAKHHEIYKTANGQHYILKQGQNILSMTDTEKHSAQKAYEHAKSVPVHDFISQIRVASFKRFESQMNAMQEQISLLSKAHDHLKENLDLLKQQQHKINNTNAVALNKASSTPIPLQVQRPSPIPMTPAPNTQRSTKEDAQHQGPKFR